MKVQIMKKREGAIGECLRNEHRSRDIVNKLQIFFNNEMQLEVGTTD